MPDEVRVPVVERAGAGSHLVGSLPQSCTQSALDAYKSRRMVSGLWPHAVIAVALISTSVIEDDERRRFIVMTSQSRNVHIIA